jgi:hypothetical protein
VTDASSRACIILAPPDVPDTPDRADPFAVRDDLIDRSYAPRLCSDPYHACVELCLLERGQSTRQHWGLKRHTSPALVYLRHHADPDWNRTLDELIAVLRRDLPGCRIIEYVDGELCETVPPPAEPDSETAPSAAPAASHDPPAPKTNGHLTSTDSTPLPITDSPAEHGDPAASTESDSDALNEAASAAESRHDEDSGDDLPSERLSRAEIDMLLGSDAFDDDAEAPSP